MRILTSLVVFVLTLFPLAAAPPPPPTGLTYDLVYVRCPRFGDTTPAKFQDVFNPTNLNPGCDLMRLRQDGSEELLVAGGLGSVADPFVSFDGTKVYFTSYPNLQPNQIGGSPYLLAYPNLGADIAVVDVATKQVTLLTTHTGPQLNIHPTPVSGGKIAFISTRTEQVGVKTNGRNFQLYVMDADGQNVVAIAPMSLSAVLHPFQLKDGRVCFSTQEGQGIRDARMWGYWCTWPDGRHFEPLDSAFDQITARHFATQLSNEDLVIERYYNLNTQGFGGYIKFPKYTGPLGLQFGPPDPRQNPALPQTIYPSTPTTMQFPFQEWGATSITPFTHGQDRPAPTLGGILQGHVQQPSGAPNNDLLTVWSANTPAANFPTPAADAGLYLIKGGAAIPDIAHLVLVKNDPNYNEVWPRALVTYKAIYGVDEPAVLPWLPNDGTVHPALPTGTPFSLIGTSGVYKKQSTPWNGLDCGNCSGGDVINWVTQGSDAGLYTPADIETLRIVTEQPTPYTPAAGIPQVSSHAQERLAILAEIPLRKFVNNQPVLDPDGNPDTSFLAKIPADTPFTFQLLDKNGMVLTMAQTWHDTRPGELHADCGGCHYHNGTPLAFDQSAAGKPGFVPFDATASGKLIKVEFLRDIRPILQAKCVSCHTGGDATAPGLLDLNNQTPVSAYRFAKQIPGDYARLAANFQVPSKWGIPPQQPMTGWWQTNASRYVKMLQARRSLVVWKFYGARLDGQTNQSDPTGPPFSVGTVDHSQMLTAAEKLLWVRWIDLGCQVGAEVLTDTLRPTLTISSPRQNVNQTVTQLAVGVADADSGISTGSLSITADIAINGRPAGTELAGLGTLAPDGRWTWPVAGLTNISNGHITSSVKDLAGNTTSLVVRFSSGGGPPPPIPPPTGLVCRIGQTLTDNLTGQKVNYPMACTWNPVAQAKRYEVVITYTPNGLEVMNEKRLIAPGFFLPIAYFAGSYQYKVKACDSESLTTAQCSAAATGTFSR